MECTSEERSKDQPQRIWKQDITDLTGPGLTEWLNSCKTENSEETKNCTHCITDLSLGNGT